MEAETSQTPRVETERSRRLRIGVDLDEVLADLVISFLDHHHERTGERFHREEMESYNFWELWDGTREDAIAKVNEFYESDGFRNLEPVTGSTEAIGRLGREHELIIITSRPDHVADHTHQWLDRHFPGAFSEIHLTNHWSNGHSVSKSEICDRLGIDLMIEDSFEYATECATPERPVLLLDSPWNKGKDLPPNVVRARDWNQATGTIERFAGFRSPAT